MEIPEKEKLSFIEALDEEDLEEQPTLLRKAGDWDNPIVIHPGAKKEVDKIQGVRPPTMGESIIERARESMDEPQGSAPRVEKSHGQIPGVNSMEKSHGEIPGGRAGERFPGFDSRGAAAIAAATIPAIRGIIRAASEEEGRRIIERMIELAYKEEGNEW